MTDNRLICVGVISTVHGVRGQVKIKSFMADESSIGELDVLYNKQGEPAYKINVTGGVKGALIAWVEGVSDRNAAEALKGRELYIPRDLLPEIEDDEFYYEDLIGLSAVSTDGEALGSVKAIHNYGAGDIIEVVGSDGKEFMYPFTKQFVPKVDIAGKKVVIDIPEEIIGKEQ